ncbi:MAG: carboxypeptidase regulatory-like domain-containing protein, partial [Verrucomicrobiota bacterium]
MRTDPDRRRLLLLVVGGCAALAAACDSGSSSSPGTILGSATVAATGKTGGIRVVIPSLQRMTTTDSSGSFLVADVPPGTYSVEAEDNAYRLRDRKIATVIGGMTTRVDFSLSPDPSIGTVAGTVPRSAMDPLGATVWASVRGGYAFLGDMQGGVPIVDVSDPAHPRVASVVPVTPNPPPTPNDPPYANYGKSYMTYATG